MFKYVKKSITRQYLFSLTIVIVLALIGAAALTYSSSMIQEKTNEKKTVLTEKLAVVKEIEDHLIFQFFHARGYYLFKNTSELADFHYEKEQLEEAVKHYATLDLDDKEQVFLSELDSFLDYSNIELFPLASKYVENDDYASLRKLAASGATDTVRGFIDKSQKFSTGIDDSVAQLNEDVVRTESMFKKFYYLYIFIILLVLIVVMRKIGNNIGRPLGKLTKASEQIVRGQDVEFKHLQREDELGTFSRAFLQMVRSIQSKEEELMSQNEELLSQQVALEEQRVNLEHSLHELKSLNGALNESAIVVITNEKGKITYVNEKFCEISQYTKEELMGRDHRIINSDYHDKAFFKNLWETILAGEVWSGEIKNKAKDGSFYWVETTIVPYLNSAGKPYQFIAIRTDVTSIKLAEEMKSELVSTVSHELRTPLSSVLGFTELMLTKDLKPERQKKYLETIHKEASRLTNLINDFLDIQRLESGKQTYEKQEFNLVLVAKEIINQFETTHKQHQFTIDSSADVVMILGDEEKLIQLFTNLISNAVKFSPEGGKVSINFEINENEVLFSVTDEGLGIPEEEVTNLFQKFYRIDNSDRRKIGGTGLGLAICKQIVEAHNGEISVSSTLGKGSVFIVKLPSVSVPTAEKYSTIQQNSYSPLLIIVEDDESLGSSSRS